MSCTYIIASRNIADWWLAYWISHTHKPNNSSVTLFTQGEFPNHTTHSVASDNLAFYLGIYGGLATANSVRDFVPLTVIYMYVCVYLIKCHIVNSGSP